MSRLKKALSEKMALLLAEQKEKEWHFDVRGESKNVYHQIFTTEKIECSCPDFSKRKVICKHMLFLISRVSLQLELCHKLSKTIKNWNEESFKACSLSLVNRLRHYNNNKNKDENKEEKNIEGTCTICFEDLSNGEQLSKCEKVCKNSFHKICLDRWFEHSPDSTCPLCRTTIISISEEEESKKDFEEVEVKIEEKEECKDECKETDILISFDTTGSMYPCLSEVRRNVSDLVKKLFKEVPSLRLGIIAHGDYCDGDKVISVLDFTDNIDDLCKFIKDVPQTSGGDYPECYELVLHTAKNMRWRETSSMKSLVMIGDATPHDVNDNPKHINWIEEANDLSKMNIQIFSIQCLYNGRKDAYDFYSTISKMTNGYHLFMNQFSYIKDMILAVCYKQYSDQHLQNFEEEMEKQGMTNTMRLMFDTILGKKTHEDIENEMGPERFSRKYSSSSSSHRTYSYDRTSELKPCPPSKFQVFKVEEDCGIQDFCDKMGITFRKGRGFYEFVKSEIIQPQKDIILMDKETGELYEGGVARSMAGMGENKENQRMKPTDVPKYRVFIQSTSYNRKLVKNQGFLYEVV